MTSCQLGWAALYTKILSSTQCHEHVVNYTLNKSNHLHRAYYFRVVHKCVVDIVPVPSVYQVLQSEGKTVELVRPQLVLWALCNQYKHTFKAYRFVKLPLFIPRCLEGEMYPLFIHGALRLAQHPAGLCMNVSGV